MTTAPPAISSLMRSMPCTMVDGRPRINLYRVPFSVLDYVFPLYSVAILLLGFRFPSPAHFLPCFPSEVEGGCSIRPHFQPLHSPFSPSLSACSTVSLSHTLASSYMVLSTVNVPLRCYPSVLQHRRKQSMRCQTHCSFFHKWPFFALLFMAPTRIYALPGTNHAIIPESSLDSFRQHALRTTAINNAVTRANSSPPFPPTVDDAVTVDDDLPTQPYSFITDTDSNQYLLHTGANRVILNDAKLLRNFQLANGNVKGVGGSPALIH